MKLLWAMAVTALLLVPLGLAADEKKDDAAARLLGTWEVTKATDDNLVGAVITFAKDGKLSMTLKMNGEEMKLEGTYKLDKEKLYTEFKVGDNTAADTDTIKKITADAIELENNDGKIVVMKKKSK